MTSVDDFMKKAHVFLKSAELLLREGDADSAVSRAYCAMLYAARAALWAAGLGEPPTTKTHDGVIRRFSEHFVKSGMVSRELGRAMTFTFQLRGVADYGDSFVTVEDGAERLEVAKRFVAEAAAIVEAQNLP